MGSKPAVSGLRAAGRPVARTGYDLREKVRHAPFRRVLCHAADRSRARLVRRALRAAHYAQTAAAAPSLGSNTSDQARNILLPYQALLSGAGTTTRVSIGNDVRQGNGNSWAPAISADGRFVAFESEASNLVAEDTNEVSDVFVHDRQTLQTTRVSVAGGGGQLDGDSIVEAISADGCFVAFVYGEETQYYISDVFVHDRQTGQTTRASVAIGGAQGNGRSGFAKISADGRFVAFSSSATNLVAGDTNRVNDVFVHDRQTGQTTRVSVATDGTQGNGQSGYPVISADGRFVAFASNATNLVARDTNNAPDIFVHNQHTRQITRVSMMTSERRYDGSTTQLSISANGRFVAFDSSATNLVAGDANNRWDVFVYDRGESGERRPPIIICRKSHKIKPLCMM